MDSADAILLQEDAERISSADVAVVEHRRRLLEEWYSWRAQVEEEIAEEREALGLPDVAELLRKKTEALAVADGEQVIEEVVEEVLEETEEIVQ